MSNPFKNQFVTTIYLISIFYCGKMILFDIDIFIGVVFNVDDSPADIPKLNTRQT